MALDCPKTIAASKAGRRDWREPQRPAATRQNAQLKDHIIKMFVDLSMECAVARLFSALAR